MDRSDRILKPGDDKVRYGSPVSIGVVTLLILVETPAFSNQRLMIGLHQ